MRLKKNTTLNAEGVIEANGGADAGAVKAATIDGKLYAYPETADNGYFMFYNKEYFTEDDIKSLDQMMKIAADNGKKITLDYTSPCSILADSDFMAHMQFV